MIITFLLTMIDKTHVEIDDDIYGWSMIISQSAPI